MKYAAAALAGLLLNACAPAANNAAPAPKAPDEEAILATVDAFFTAMAEKDAGALRAIVAPGAAMVAIGYGPDGARPPRRSGIQGFIDGVGAEDYPDRVHEAYWDPTVLQRDGLAVVWTPYRIDIGGERRHCGVDVFNLSREDGKWLVDSISFTMEPGACGELEPEGVAARPVFAD